MVVEIDPGGTLDPALGLTRRIPEVGSLAVEVRQMPVFNLTMIPFVLAGSTDRTIVQIVNDLTPDHERLWDTRTLLPIGDMEVIAHDPVETSTNNQNRLLAQTNAIRIAEGGVGHYMGTMVNSDGGGLAYLGGFASFSDPRPDIIAHELGHNMSLSHAPCSAPGADPWYPAPGGMIGSWGYDFRGGGMVVPPDTPDMMGYCHPRWIGGYHFSNALRYRQSTEGRVEDGPPTTAHAGRPHETLLLWGGIEGDGTPYLEPAFVLDAPASLPTGGGPWELLGSSAEGETLFQLTFGMPRVPHGGGASSFAFAVPIQSTWEAELASVVLRGPSGTASLDRWTENPTLIVRDPRTGQVRAILNESASGAGAAPVFAGMEVLTSDGIPEPNERR